jgi:cytochrome c oxidase cbb3-type subunit 3
MSVQMHRLKPVLPAVTRMRNLCSLWGRLATCAGLLTRPRGGLPSRRRMPSCPTGLNLFLVMVTVALAQAQPDLEKGKKLFIVNCATCHGIDGGGGAGPSLRKPKLARAATKEDLQTFISRGNPDAGMPGSFHLGPDGLATVTDYVLSLGKVAETPLAGDPVHGREVYAKAGCAGCHIVQGYGNGIGPELTEVGNRRSGAALREILLHPDKNLPANFMMIQVKTLDGKTFMGARVNEDTVTIQLKDANGKFHSFRKDQLEHWEKQPGKTWMPPYSGADVDDLVAWLAGQRGKS